MNTPEQTLRLQTRLSEWHGTRKIAGWFIILALVLCGVVFALIARGEMRIGELATPLLLALVAGLLHRRAKKRINEIELALSA